MARKRRGYGRRRRTRKSCGRNRSKAAARERKRINRWHQLVGQLVMNANANEKNAKKKKVKRNCKTRSHKVIKDIRQDIDALMRLLRVGKGNGKGNGNGKKPKRNSRSARYLYQLKDLNN